MPIGWQRATTQCSVIATAGGPHSYASEDTVEVGAFYDNGDWADLEWVDVEGYTNEGSQIAGWVPIDNIPDFLAAVRSMKGVNQNE